MLHPAKKTFPQREGKGPASMQVAGNSTYAPGACGGRCEMRVTRSRRGLGGNRHHKKVILR